MHKRRPETSRRLASWPAAAAVALLALASPAHAQTAAEKLYMYRGADREQRILENAKREGVVVLYTSLAPSESVPLTQAFEKKYGIKVDLWRSNSEKVTQRTVSEARGNRFSVDAVETIGTDLERMAREKIFAEFHSPHLADLIASAIPSHRGWFPDRISYLGVGYNTRLVRKEDLPRTYEGFLDPKWKGMVGIESSDTVWLAGIVKFWGQERGMKFFNALSRMKPDVRTGHTLVAQLVAAGEVPVGLTTYSSGAVSGKRTGAPIDWAPIEPVIAQPLGIGLARNAPHPHAALLFADFVLSPEGQELFNSLGRPPANRKVKTGLGNFESVMMDPAVELDENDKWQALWNQLFLGK
jgi:iron(III) transport system substrate-binding protein